MKLSRTHGTLALLAAASAALALATPASAAITTTTITTPSSSPLYLLYNAAAASNTFAIAGTTDSTVPATDKVDIRCFFQSTTTSSPVATGVTLAGDGSFSVPAAPLSAVLLHVCRLRAVPTGTTSGTNAYRGPLLLTSYTGNLTIVGGPNNGTLYGFYDYGQQLAGAGDYESLGFGGLYDSYLFNQSYGADAVVFYSNAYLWQGMVGDTRASMQVDGQNAYAPQGAANVFGRTGACPPTCDGSVDNSGFPALTHTFSQNSSTGDVTINESNPIVRCPSGIAYPPTHATCGAFTSTGVKVERIIKQDHNGRVVFISDFFSSTDGHTHTIDLLYGNAQYLGNSHYPNIGYLFPGTNSYTTHTAGDTVTVPNRPGTVYIKNVHSDDGDPVTGQGSITYAQRPTQMKFTTSRYTTAQSSDFTMHYAGTVPASGALTYKFGYATDYTTADLVANSLEVLHSFEPCVIPKLKGKTLPQAKSALKKAYCELGKVTKASSKTVKKGRVISSKPGKGVKKPFGTLVNLRVSKGTKKK